MIRCHLKRKEIPSLEVSCVLICVLSAMLTGCGANIAEHSANRKLAGPSAASLNLLKEVRLKQGINSSTGKEKLQFLCELETLKSNDKSSVEDLELIQQITTLAREMYGSDSAEYADALSRKGYRFGKEGDYDRAAKFYEEAEAIYAAKGSDFKRKQMDCVSRIIANECINGQCYQKDYLYEQLVDLRKQVLGVQHPHTIVAMSLLGETYLKEQKFAKAEKVFNEILKITAGQSVRTVLPIWLNLSRCYIGLHRDEDALHCLKLSYDAGENLYKNDSRDSMSLKLALANYVIYYENHKNWKDALACAVKQLHLEEQSGRSNSAPLRRVLGVYANLLEADGQNDNALSVRKRLNELEISRPRVGTNSGVADVAPPVVAN